MMELLDYKSHSEMVFRTIQLKPLTNGDVTFGAQFLGTISVVVFVFIVSFIVFQIIKSTIGLRISKEAERLGTDKAEVGVIAYGIRD